MCGCSTEGAKEQIEAPSLFPLPYKAPFRLGDKFIFMGLFNYEYYKKDYVMSGIHMKVCDCKNEILNIQINDDIRRHATYMGDVKI
jgi:hypothetical protein